MRGKVIPKKSQEQSTHILYDVVDRIPFIDFLGVKFDLFEDKLIARLPFKPELIGNGFIKALHGGAIGSFLETVAIVELAHYLNMSEKIPQKMGKNTHSLQSISETTSGFEEPRLSSWATLVSRL